ncbi:MAG: hypothetical protein ACQEP7_03580 [bacterium]
MKFTIDPIFSAWILVLIFTGLAGLIFRSCKTKTEFFLQLVGAAVLFLIGLQFSFTAVELVAPEKPVKIVRENFSGGDYKQLDGKVDELSRKLRSELGDENLKVESLDNRWDTRPVFDDYNLLAEKLSGFPVEIIAGWGRHTGVNPGYFTDRGIADSPARRALLVPDSSPARGGLETEEPVIYRDSPGKVQWPVDVRVSDRLNNPRLVLKREGRVVKENSSPSSGRLRFISPEQDEGRHYFTLELLQGDEKRLPAGHRRRLSVGAIVEDYTRRLLIVDAAPTWRSGWWGRKIKGLEGWEVEYHYRRRAETSSPPEADVVLYFGFPESRGALEQLKVLLAREAGFLFVPSEIDSQGLARSAMQEFGVKFEQIIRRRGQFSLSLAEKVSSYFPALLAFNRQVEAAPPLEFYYGGLKGDDYRAILKAGEDMIFSLHQEQARGIITYPDFHRLAMSWGKMGYPETGKKIAREIVQKLERKNQREEGELFDRGWVFAGERIEPAQDLAGLALREPYERKWPGQPPESMAFARPGNYRFEFQQEGEKFTRNLLVVESNEMRNPEEEAIIENLVQEENIFDSVPAVVRWTKKNWKNKHREKEVEIFNWSHPILLLLAGVSLAGSWFIRDRYSK